MDLVQNFQFQEPREPSLSLSLEADPRLHNLQNTSPDPGNVITFGSRRLYSNDKTESKPRLSDAAVQNLERVFQENPRPSSSVLAQLADGLMLERPRINVDQAMRLNPVSY